MNIITILSILFIHWFADFVMQTDKMAKGKSTSNYWLTKHVATYVATFYVLGLGLMFLNPINFNSFFIWILINGVLHWITDYFTSRLNTYLYKKNDIHNFFISVGFDQFIHYSCLLISYKILWK